MHPQTETCSSASPVGAGKAKNTLIVGASAAGLACAACLQKLGVEYIIVEKEAQVAMPWRNRYDRLHLHTSKEMSHLPFKKFDNSVPRYPSREQVITYLEAYRQCFNIEPVFNTEVKKITRESARWAAVTNAGSFHAKNIVLATGVYGRPKDIAFKGTEHFQGRILHSCMYKTGTAFRGQKVLVVGFGNSACEIAIDLYEQGAYPSMAVRSAVNLIPRDLLGVPVVKIGLLLSRLPARVADMLTAPVSYLYFGNIRKLGLRRQSYGTFRQIQQEGKIPLIDIGTMGLIRKGQIRIFPGIDHIAEKTVYFTDGRGESFDAIVAAIGYDSAFQEMLETDADRLQDLCRQTRRQQRFGEDGLYGCGFWVGPSGQLREIALDARKIARDIFLKEKNELAAHAF